jgi:hypothetical protein
MYNTNDRSLAGTILGVLLGGLVGYLLRPSAFLVGQLPLETVITRGAYLQGLDQLLVGTAQASFNYLFVGAVIGGVVGCYVGLGRKT